MKYLVVPRQRAYVLAHPLAIWLAVSFAAVGLLQLIFPSTTGQSPATLVLPDWLRFVFNLTWAVGGGLSVFGILRGRPKLDAAGCILLCSGLLIDLIAVAYIHFQLHIPALTPAGIGFLVALAYGFFVRSNQVASRGYE